MRIPGVGAYAWGEDDDGMRDASDDELFAWCDDCADRLGCDEGEFRSALLDYVTTRRSPSTTIKPRKPVGILPPIGNRRAAFAAVFAAGRDAFGKVGLTCVDAERAFFQRTGDPTFYSVAITPAEYRTLTTAGGAA